MKRKGSLLLSVDVPSGFPTDFHLLPDITVTFHEMKAGMTEEHSGNIEIVDIGIPEKAVKYTGPGEMLLYPVPANDTHKGNNGIITVIGGGAFAGAPTFASLAAYRTGADLVYTVVPKKSFGVASVFSPNMMVFSTAHQAFEPADEAAAMKWVERSGSLVIGPGMDSDSKTHVFIRRIMKKAKCSMVVDASAIEVAGDNSCLIAGKNVIVTPHSKEFEKLTGDVVAKTIAERSEQIRSWAHKLDVTILLKGATDVISDGRRVKLNDTGNPGMTVGGTGDVLTGIAAELMAKGCSPFDSGRLAAYINGSSGEICFRSKSFGLLATDVIESIPDVLVRDLGGNQ
jgi:NAD(P)H-hydrate epimerase